jgi:hypothetical protein
MIASITVHLASVKYMDVSLHIKWGYSILQGGGTNNGRGLQEMICIAFSVCRYLRVEGLCQ